LPPIGRRTIFGVWNSVARSIGITALLFFAGSLALFFVVPALAWGSVSGLLAHPARAGAFVIIIGGSVAFFFAGTNFATFKWDDPKSRSVIMVALPITAVIAYLPAYADRHDYAVLDGDVVRYVGLVTYAIGCWLRMGPMFALKQRFRAPWTEQQEHYLVTTGYYRYIRHPSYLGVLVALVGWMLIFRCWIGALLCLLMIPLGIPQIRKEEAKLLEELGVPYAEYQQRTWLWPFIKK
jgi:protein-S-isoprenylcysteine O-methyltransferase Ste14